MKKRVTLSIMLSMIVICFFSTINPTKANPMPIDPKITIISPTNPTYKNNSLPLNIKITTQYDGYYFNSSERRITYSLDNKKNIPLELTSYSYNEDTKTSIVEASTVLTALTQGTHSLTVYVEYDYDVKVIDSSSTINFSINSPNSFPVIELVSIVIVITFITSIFIFYKKRSGEKQVIAPNQ